MNRLREIRFFKKVNQYQLALLSGVYQSRISLAENGLIELRKDEQKAIAKALKVSVREIFPKNVSSISLREQSCAVAGAR
jgi:transcriptional regulator with XRE-family HTH domain